MFAKAMLMGSSQAGLFRINDSLRFNDDDGAYLTRTPSVAGNRKTWTWSGWVKRGNLGKEFFFFVDRTGSNNEGVIIGFTSANEFSFYQWSGSSYDYRLRTNAVYRDPSAWYHIVCVLDTTKATANDRQKIYINGIEVTSFSVRDNPSLNLDGLMSDTKDHYFGRTTELFDGYLSDVHFIDGQALDPTSFGKEDADGVWQPISYTGTYGTNGFHLDFADNSTAAALGTDVSGNSNDWTPSGITTDDQVSDTPSVNYATLNPLDRTTHGSLANGNLDLNTSGGTSPNAFGTTRATFGLSSGKWYWEITPTSFTDGGMIGIMKSSASLSLGVGQDSNGWSYLNGGSKYTGASASAYGASYTTSDVIGVAFDADTGTLDFYKNGASQGTAFTGLTSGPYFPAVSDNGGSSTTGSVFVANFGQRPFAYTPPTGFQALNSANLPVPTIKNGAKHFDTVLWNATGTQSVQGLEFQPDFLWLKARSTSGSHHLMDAVRGAANFLQSDTTDAETNSPNFLTSFDSTGFSFGSNNWSDGRSMVGWNWNAGGSTVTNIDGSITSQVRANTTAGFSIVSYTGPGNSVVGTIGHGLSQAPDVIIVKSRSNARNWFVYHSGVANANTGRLLLNTNDAFGVTTGAWNDTSPTSSVFTVGGVNETSAAEALIAYCFHSVDGFSKFGSYTGNGSADGPFVYTGFRPAFVMFKRTDSTSDWNIYDSSRAPFNVNNKVVQANLSNSEATPSVTIFDYLSNGFKPRGNAAAINASGGTYIYMAFAENPFKKARAR